LIDIGTTQKDLVRMCQPVPNSSDKVVIDGAYEAVTLDLS